MEMKVAGRADVMVANLSKCTGLRPPCERKSISWLVAWCGFIMLTSYWWRLVDILAGGWVWVHYADQLLVVREVGGN